MNLSKYINYVPYIIGWKVAKIFRKQTQIDFMCGTLTDYSCMEKVIKHFPQARIVARSKKLQNKLKEIGVESVKYPTFPDVAIMSRHIARKFPGKNILKIGMRHGPYHFKDFINSRYYNEFNHYFFTSQTEVKQAKERGILSGVYGGYPKIDAAFDGSYSVEKLESLKNSLNIDRNKPIILFSATWNKTNYSAIYKWYNKLNELVDDYNILVTVHDWTTKEVKEELINNDKINYITDKTILPYLMIADLMVGDISSIIAEFCALDKPIITFRVLEGKRTTEEIINILDNISFRIDTFAELVNTLPIALTKEKDLHKEQRNHFNKVMLGDLDGKAHDRIARKIKDFIDVFESKR